MAIFKPTRTLFGWCHLVARGCSFARRKPREAVLAFRMAGWILFISGMAKVLAMPRVFSIITPRHQAASREVEPDTVDLKLAKLADQLLNLNFLVFTPTCWKRAAVLYRYLALHGIRTRIVFGVSKRNDGLLDGHAWLEAEGRPFLEPKNPEYTVTYSFPT